MTCCDLLDVQIVTKTFTLGVDLSDDDDDDNVNDDNDDDNVNDDDNNDNVNDDDDDDDSEPVGRQ